ncbi:MAG TPA: TonB family protein [Mucilaginibacter sp.]
MNWLHYLLEANIYLAVFYLLYFALLNNTTHYKMNRAYLLITSVVAYIIPVLQLGMLRQHDYGDRQTATIMLNPNLRPSDTHVLTLQDGLLYTYIIGTLITMIVLIFKVTQLVKLTNVEKISSDDGYKLITLQDSNTAFSFFNYVFIGTKVSGADTVLRHELVHINQKHSLDILFLEVMKIIGWFNPFIYLVQRSLKTVHEYIADEQTAAYENDTLAYSSFLVNNAYGVSGTSITHSFFNYNLLKKRIIMLNQKRSGNLARLKYLAALPVCAGLLCVSTLGFSKTYGWVDIAPRQQTDTIKTVKVSVPVKEQVSKEVKLQLKEQRKKADQKQKVVMVTLLPPAKTDKVKEITIDPPLVKKSQEITIDEPKVVKVKASPDVAPREKLTEVRIIGPVKSADKASKADVTEVSAKPSADMVQQKTPPPPPPAMPPPSAFGDFSKYISKYVRYPASARENDVMGSVIVKFDLTGDHKVANASVVKGIGSHCDEEALRVVKAYPQAINTKSGTYKIAVTFYINGKELKNTASGDLFNDPSFIGEVSVTTFKK